MFDHRIAWKSHFARSNFIRCVSPWHDTRPAVWIQTKLILKAFVPSLFPVQSRIRVRVWNNKFGCGSKIKNLAYPIFWHPGTVVTKWAIPPNPRDWFSPKSSKAQLPAIYHISRSVTSQRKSAGRPLRETQQPRRRGGWGPCQPPTTKSWCLDQKCLHFSTLGCGHESKCWDPFLLTPQKRRFMDGHPLISDGWRIAFEHGNTFVRSAWSPGNLPRNGADPGTGIDDFWKICNPAMCQSIKTLFWAFKFE